ncbi:MAG: iron ABC transporter permease [Deltaproteobacteria bacterium]|jgi:iron complex transport system permease protein|nr:iron ABC transporter permease [Deltaproteobacteria bacterium]
MTQIPKSPKPYLAQGSFGRSPWALGLFLLILLALIAWLSLSQGYVTIEPKEIWDILWAKYLGLELDPRGQIIWESRLPRMATAMAAGAALGLSGCVFQGLLLNPLADPYTLGVSSGAALGASGVILLGFFGPVWLSNPLMPTAGAFLGAGLALISVLALARQKDGRYPPTNLILSGVILSAILSAALSFFKYLAGDQVSSIVFWLLGSFLARTWVDAFLVMGFFLPAFLVSLWSAVDLNVMTLGLGPAKTLGVNVQAARVRLLAAASLAAASAVAVSGVIGFVGLITPHLTRLAVGPDHRALIPLSALAGATLLSGADLVARVVLPGEIPVGVLTATLAGPVFLAIFRKKARELANA